MFIFQFITHECWWEFPQILISNNWGSAHCSGFASLLLKFFSLQWWYLQSMILFGPSGLFVPWRWNEYVWTLRLPREFGELLLGLISSKSMTKIVGLTAHHEVIKLLLNNPLLLRVALGRNLAPTREESSH